MIKATMIMKKFLLTALAFVAFAVSVNAQSYYGGPTKSYVDRKTLYDRAANYVNIINDKNSDVKLSTKNGKKAWFGLGGSFLGWYDESITESEKKILDKEGYKKENSGSDPMNVSTKKDKKKDKNKNKKDKKKKK